MDNLEKAREFFSKDLYATKLSGARIDSIGEGFAQCSMDIIADHKNAVGQVMGGAIFTLADFAFAVATNFDKPYPTVTLTSNISFLSAVKGRTLIAKAKLIKDGSRSCFYTVEVSDELDTPVALLNVSGAKLIKQTK